MKNKIIFLCFFIFLLYTKITPQVAGISSLDSSLAFYPMKIGNKWAFNETITFIDPPYIQLRVWSQEILEDTLMPNGQNYRVIKNVYSDNNPISDYSFERIDSSQNKIFKYYPDSDTTNYEILILDLSIEPFDTFYNPYCFAVFGDIGTINKFGQMYNYRSYFWECGLLYSEYTFLENLGLYHYSYYVDFVQSSSNLKGCLINGVLYGDTIVVSVKDKPTLTPNTFRLEQNYPNPFNPTTKIKFTIPNVIANETKQSQMVTLKVYDVLGNEVTTLVNKELVAGEYEVDFTASSGIRDLVSGIYFYRLKVEDYIQSRKMILLK
jgi:hypothetical protein